MSLMHEGFMGEESQLTQVGCLAREIAGWLRRRHPDHTIKRVAAELRCSAKAAENLLNGHLSAPAMGRLLAAFGPSIFIEASLAAAGTSLDAYIESEVQRAAQERRRWADEADRYYELGRRLGAGTAPTGRGPRSSARS